MSSYKELHHPDVHCPVDFGDNLKPMKMSDAQKLAMLREKARNESGNFSCLTFFKAILFVGVVATFAFVFYRIACLQIEVNYLSSRLDVIRSKTLDQRSRPCNCTSPISHSKSKFRSRRSVDEAQQQDGEHDAAVENRIDSQIPSYADRFSAHLLPADGNTTLTQGQLFTWTDTKSRSFLEPSGFELIDDQYLFVPVAGYYFVYSQITFNDSLTRTIGHQLILWGRCGRNEATILMATSLTQQTRPTSDLSRSKKDSSYLGGVVYLSAGDYLAVRPDFGGTTKINYTRLESNTFFGAFLINRDSKGPSMKENCVV